MAMQANTIGATQWHTDDNLDIALTRCSVHGVQVVILYLIEKWEIEEGNSFVAQEGRLNLPA